MHHIRKILRRRGIVPAIRRNWCISTDLEFAVKAAAIAGLYPDPPENALVLCVTKSLRPGPWNARRREGHKKSGRNPLKIDALIYEANPNNS